MNITPQCILNIKQSYPDLKGKYKNIADYMLSNPEKIIQHKVREIARDCKCDDALIIRFCQKIGYSGFSELKVSFASEFMPSGIDVASKEFSVEDSFAKLKQNFQDNNLKALHDTVGLLNEKTVKKAVKILSKAAKIYICGRGVSGIVAEDVQMKLARVGFNVIFHKDQEFSKVFLGLCNKNDAVLAISFSGETQSICKTASMAKEKKIPVISITNYPNSTLVDLSDVSLITASDEKVFRLGAMTSRLAQYYVIDFLIINLVLDNMERSEEYILRTHQMINGKNK